MASVIEMREKRASIFHAMKSLVERTERARRGFTGEEEQQWGRMNSEIDQLAQQILAAEQSERVSGLGFRDVEAATWSEADVRFNEWARGNDPTRRVFDIGFSTETRDLLAGSGTGQNVV